jgi:hypothetical protein
MMGHCKDMSIPEGPKFLSLDADTTGHYLVVIAEHHTQVEREVAAQGMVITEDQMFDLYLLGNTEGRLLHGFVTLEDIEMIECWESELRPDTQDNGVGEF